MMPTRTSAFRSWMSLFQTFEIVRCKQGAHLGDSDFIELKEALGLGNTLADENGIEALEICEDDKLLKRRMVATMRRLSNLSSSQISRASIPFSSAKVFPSPSASLSSMKSLSPRCAPCLQRTISNV